MIEHCPKDEYLNSFCRTRLKLLNSACNQQTHMIDIFTQTGHNQSQKRNRTKKFECDLDAIVEMDRERRIVFQGRAGEGGQKATNDEMSKLKKVRRNSSKKLFR